MFDIENQVSVAQAFTGSATVSANAYEKQSAAQKISIGRRMAMAVYFSATGAGTTHTLDLIQADNAALTTNKEVIGTIDVATADVVIGEAIEIPMPENSDTRKYLGFQHAATGGTTTATIDAYLMPQDEITKNYVSFPKVVDAEL